MRKVRCYECGKGYDYDEDGFCPNCGAFNLPRNHASIGADGGVVWHEDINERNHKGSFVHEEFHEENEERKGTPLEQTVRRMVYTAVPSASKEQKGAKKPGFFTMALIILGIIVFMNVFSNLTMLFY